MCPRASLLSLRVSSLLLLLSLSISSLLLVLSNLPCFFRSHGAGYLLHLQPLCRTLPTSLHSLSHDSTYLLHLLPLCKTLLTLYFIFYRGANNLLHLRPLCRTRKIVTFIVRPGAHSAPSVRTAASQLCSLLCTYGCLAAIKTVNLQLSCSFAYLVLTAVTKEKDHSVSLWIQL